MILVNSLLEESQNFEGPSPQGTFSYFTPICIHFNKYLEGYIRLAYYTIRHLLACLKLIYPVTVVIYPVAVDLIYPSSYVIAACRDRTKHGDGVLKLARYSCLFDDINTTVVTISSTAELVAIAH